LFGNAKLREFASLYYWFTLSYTESTFQCFQGAYRVYTQRVGKETPGETFHGSRTVHRVAKKTRKLYESRRRVYVFPTRRFHELVGNPRQSRPPIFQSYFLRSFFRSFVRHRHPVAASYRLFSRRRGLTSSVLTSRACIQRPRGTRTASRTRRYGSRGRSRASTRGCRRRRRIRSLS
jgi:hypothetical protein